MVVSVCRITLLAPHCHSLKQKRGVVRRIKDRVRAKFHVSLAEVGGQDTWQRAVLGFAVTGSDRGYAESAVDKIVNAIEAMGLARISSVEREALVYSDEPFAESGSWGHDGEE